MIHYRLLEYEFSFIDWKSVDLLWFILDIKLTSFCHVGWEKKLGNIKCCCDINKELWFAGGISSAIVFIFLQVRFIFLYYVRVNRLFEEPELRFDGFYTEVAFFLHMVLEIELESCSMELELFHFLGIINFLMLTFSSWSWGALGCMTLWHRLQDEEGLLRRLVYNETDNEM